MDDNKEMLNEENRATPDQPAVTEEETNVAEEVPQEPEPPEIDSAAEEETVPELTETSVEDVPPEDIALEGEAISQTEAPQTEASEQSSEQEPTAHVGEAPVEMLNTTQTESEGQKSGDGQQAVENAEASGPPSAVISPPDAEQPPTVESVIEAILFATDEPLPEGKLAGIVETTARQVRESVDSLNARYQANNNAFRIEQIAGGYQMLTQPIYNSWLKKMVRVRSDNKLSPAAMETLAIIAYKQPIIRADIEAVRGVAVGEVVRSLMYKGLVKIAGRAEILGRPMLYGTTKKFLEIFGLNSIKDLPKAEDLKNPDRG